MVPGKEQWVTKFKSVTDVITRSCAEERDGETRSFRALKNMTPVERTRRGRGLRVSSCRFLKVPRR